MPISDDASNSLKPTKHLFATCELECRKKGSGYVVTLIGRTKALSTIVPDEKYPGVMWRIVEADGRLSDMVNLTRAIDAAKSRALSMLNGRAKGAAGGHAQ